MTLTNYFTLSGETVVVGVVKRGTINVGDEIEISGYRYTGKLTVKSISLISSTPLEAASYGDEINITFYESVDRTKLTWGDVISIPGTMKSYKIFTAEIYVYTEGEGGKRTLILNGYEPTIYLYNEGKDLFSTITLPEGEMIMPCSTFTISITLDSETSLWEGLEFIGKEGSKTVIKGTILSVVA